MASSKAKTSSKTKAKTSKSKTKASQAKVAKSPQEYTPDVKEIENGRKVLEILENIEDIGYTIHRDDLFTVTEPEFGLEIMVDAEQDVICLVAEICNREHLEKTFPNWAEKLLEFNNMLLHGAFTLHQDKILLRENLAAENLDANELEDALSAMFVGIIRCSHSLGLA